MAILRLTTFAIALSVLLAFSIQADDTKQTKTFQEIRSAMDSYLAIDTHDHLRPFSDLFGPVQTNKGRGMTLHSIWAGSYYTWTNKLSPWPEGSSFEEWWKVAKHDFDDARATSFYRYVLPAFKDLYGIDFETMTDAQAAELNERIFENYRNDRWLNDVIRNKAKIELMFIDPYWARLKFDRAYEFSVPVLNVTSMVSGFHASEFANPLDSPYDFAEKNNKPIHSLDDYLATLEAIFAKAVESDAICLKSTLAYQRTLEFKNVSREQAQVAFGKKRTELTPSEIGDFEDFIFWRIVEFSAKYDLPFQIHTGQARIQGSNPMLLVDLIAANPNTKFILFHGGYPWVGETGVIAMKYRNVWIDSVWLPQLSYTMAKRAYQEWLEVMPSDRIMWGADTTQAEGIYAATVWTKDCLAEALAEKVDKGELKMDHAHRIAKQVLRDNALKLFPKLNRMVKQPAP
jgi:uncharacterized protein